MRTRFSAVLLTLMLAVGSAWAQGDVTKPQYSGFLGDYSKLKLAANREGVWNYVDQNKDYSHYTKIMFEPVQVYLVPNPDYKGEQPEVLKRMTDSYLDSFRAALTPAYQIVHTPGPDVLRVRAAITGVTLVKPPLTATDFIPVKALYNLGKDVAGDATVVAEMSSELEVLDANGKRIAAGVATRKGEKALKQGDQVTWDDLQAITDYWAKGFRQSLDQARDVAPYQ